MNPIKEVERIMENARYRGFELKNLTAADRLPALDKLTSCECVKDCREKPGA
jgi:hypothetical protein